MKAALAQSPIRPVSGRIRAAGWPEKVYPLELDADRGRLVREGDAAERGVCGGDLSGDDGLLCRSDGDLSAITLRPRRAGVLNDFDHGLKDDRREPLTLSRVSPS